MNESPDQKLEKLLQQVGSTYYRRDGTPYPLGIKGLLEWGRDLENRSPGNGLTRTRLWWGGEVSTVWLGMDHAFGGGPPLIFETMLFPGCRDMDRYSTEQESQEGHRRMVRKYTWRIDLILGEIVWKLKEKRRVR